MSVFIDVPAGGAWFAGHFPSRPILPGVAELALAWDALALDIPLAGIAHARLRQLVYPGDRLELIARDAAPDRLRIDLKRGAVLVANAEFLTGGSHASATVPDIDAAPAAQGSYPPLDALLPHRPPMRFLESISSDSQTGLAGTAAIPAGCAFDRDGHASALAAIEAAAQGAAAWEAVRRRDEGGKSAPRIGYLVSMRDIRFHVAQVQVGRAFRIAVELEAASLPLTHYRIRAQRDGQTILDGAIATYLTDEFA